MDFDWGEIGKYISYFVPVVLFLIFNVFFKKRQEKKRQETVVRNLLSEIDYNQKLVQSLSLKWDTKKFKTTTWDKNKGKLIYLENDELYHNLVDTYESIGGFNREIEMAIKFKSTSYLVNISVDKLSQPFEKIRQGLENWLQLNKDKKATKVR